MQPDELKHALMQTLDDVRLSRSERRALTERLSELDLSQNLRDRFHSIAFELASEAVDSINVQLVLDWLESVTKVLRKHDQSAAVSSDALFSPGDDCWQRICSLIRTARKQIDICVFTITDDRISKVILDAHQRRVGIRIITDNDKSLDRGSDIERLARAGIPVRVDETSNHMHHKFALFDRKQLLTGSYNWTRSAAQYNEENILVSDDRQLVIPFEREFNRLWDELEPSAS